MKKEVIVCSATLYDDLEKHVHQPVNIDTGIVVCGLRHHNCLTTLAILIDYRIKIDRDKLKQGFLTSHNRFVGRYEAYGIYHGVEPSSKQLYSEDLY